MWSSRSDRESSFGINYTIAHLGVTCRYEIGTDRIIAEGSCLHARLNSEYKASQSSHPNDVALSDQGKNGDTGGSAQVQRPSGRRKKNRLGIQRPSGGRIGVLDGSSAGQIVPA
jgi:hypothetical protein